MTAHKIRVFVDSNIKEATRAIQHLNSYCGGLAYFSQREIPSGAYQFNDGDYDFVVGALLDNLDIVNGNTPESFIVISDRPAPSPTDVLTEKRVAVISTFYDRGLQDYKQLALLIFAASLELQATNHVGLLAVWCNSPHTAIASLCHAEKAIVEALQLRESSNFHVLITHGIRTHGFWAESAKKELTTSFGISSTVVRYGFINLVLFLTSKAVQTRLAHELLVKLIRIKEQSNNGDLAIIVHSYSSLLLAKALSLADRLRIDLNVTAIVLNGSILAQDFNWSDFTDSHKLRGARVKRVLNICGDNDIWPVLASHLAPGAGASGAFFFSENSNQIISIRLPDCGHSTMLTPAIARTYWGRFITDENFLPDSQVPSKWPVTTLEYLLINKKLFALVALAGILLRVIW
jgi:hypothetical protein